MIVTEIVVYKYMAGHLTHFVKDVDTWRVGIQVALFTENTIIYIQLEDPSSTNQRRELSVPNALNQTMLMVHMS